MVALGWLQAVNLAVDVGWVARLGEDALTGLAAASFGTWILVQLGELSSLGVHSLVARGEGAGRAGEAVGWLLHGVAVSLGVWIALGIAGPWVLPSYLDAVGLAPGAARDAAAALLGTSTSLACALFAQQLVGAVFRGIGDTRTALAVSTSGLVAHALLDPVFLWGLGPVPALGVAGASVASGCASACAALLGLALLARRGRLRGDPVRPSLARAAEIARVGLPLTVSGVGFSLVYVALGRMVTSFGEPCVAALGIGHRMESFTYLAAIGFSIATATLVGQHVGAGDFAGAHRAARTAVAACSGMMLVGTALAVPAAPAIYRLFTDDPALVDAGATYLRLQALVWVFMGFEVIFEGAFAGTGHTTPALWIGGSLTAARLPLAALLAWGAGLGVTGVWLAIALSTLAKGVVLGAWFARGTWEDVAARSRLRLADS
jgi:putative MATE family efflux protein